MLVVGLVVALAYAAFVASSAQRHPVGDAGHRCWVVAASRNVGKLLQLGRDCGAAATWRQATTTEVVSDPASHAADRPAAKQGATICTETLVSKNGLCRRNPWHTGARGGEVFGRKSERSVRHVALLTAGRTLLFHSRNHPESLLLATLSTHSRSDHLVCAYDVLLQYGPVSLTQVCAR